eukprot:2668455-Prymnesium_polylepis.2
MASGWGVVLEKRRVHAVHLRRRRRHEGRDQRGEAAKTDAYAHQQLQPLDANVVVSARRRAPAHLLEEEHEQRERGP